MPIRINLLAEQQAAEEARRRDPVKRAIWGAAIVVGAFLFWAGKVQVGLMRARSALRAFEQQWSQVEPKFLQVSNQISEVNSLQKNLDNLLSYSTNRFLWTEPLNALQHATDNQVRLVSVVGVSTLKEDERVVMATNIYLMRPQRRWGVFPPEPLKTNIHDLARSAVTSILTNQPFSRFQSQVVTHVKFITNRLQIGAQIEVIKPLTVAETIALKLEGRDYSKTPGSRIDPFFAQLKSVPYFQNVLGKTNAILRIPDYQARPDASDRISPDAPFISFLIECILPERFYSNE